MSAQDDALTVYAGGTGLEPDVLVSVPAVESLRSNPGPIEIRADEIEQRTRGAVAGGVKGHEVRQEFLIRASSTH